ncbi:putative RING-H2 finger protein ATL69 isoform X1 [Rosa rugosa]|uniref:putative RING-H2 finger protein ATL69 isoform X1 n=1 Tax=Rosa rugosa TaxID=74645 RepID=UPI002B4043FD|nr:putative RING-H2 finger protein ATL69 isoform X1 [Rosa rugosa]
MVPIVNYEWLDTDFGVRLTWGEPDCRSCESSGRVCGFKNDSSLQLDCSTQTNGFSGLSNAEKFRLLINVGVPGLVCITMFALYIYTLIRDRGRINEPITELSSVTIPQIHVVITGLNDLTIESYPKTQLGEKWEFPSPEDSTCPICLCEYQPEETIRTIPECNHHFHASCIDEWLRKNPTCPVCRKVPQEDNKTSLSPIET